MPTYNSPFATSFKSACNRGTSYNVAVNNIAKRNNKTPEFVWNSLHKAGLCYRQKFNGQWVYFPCNVKKGNATNCKVSQFNGWQWFCEWCLLNGFCTPEQMKNHCGSQKDFMTWCRKFWNKQYTTNTKTTGRKTTGRKTTTKRGSYKFPTTKSKTNTRWSKKAA